MATALLLLLLFTSVTYAVHETGRSEYCLMDGVTESEVYFTDSKKQNVRAHILVVDKDADVSLKVSTSGYYKNGGSTEEERSEYASDWSTDKWGFATVQEQVSSYGQTSGDHVIAAVNGDFYDDDNNGCTYGLLVMEGNLINPSANEPYFAVLKNGDRVISSDFDNIGDIGEAVAGFQWIVRDGHRPADLYDKDWKVVQAIGLTPENDIIIATIDGRDIISLGTTVADLSDLMLQLGCTDSIQLDGGGSASFLTDRSDEDGIQMRNVAADGIPRPVSSSLLIINNNSADPAEAETAFAADMTDSGTRIFQDDQGRYQYCIDGELQTGFVSVNGIPYLFAADGTGLTKDVKIANVTYYYVDGMLAGCSDKNAGEIGIGFCGADEDGKNLIFAYQYGNERLKIGKNPLKKNCSGKMANWDVTIKVPWQVKKMFVKAVRVGQGVTSIGNNFLYKDKYPFNRNAAKTKPALTSVVLPLSLKTIGYRAFRNQTRLKKITIPRNVTKIGAEAFSLNNGTVYTFKRKLPPVIGKNAFRKASSAKKLTWRVPKTRKWKLLGKNKTKKRKYGFSGKIIYVK